MLFLSKENSGPKKFRLLFWIWCSFYISPAKWQIVRSTENISKAIKCCYISPSFSAHWGYMNVYNRGVISSPSIKNTVWNLEVTEISEQLPPQKQIFHFWTFTEICYLLNIKEWQKHCKVSKEDMSQLQFSYRLIWEPVLILLILVGKSFHHIQVKALRNAQKH